MRTLVDIPNQYIKILDLICKKENISRAEAIRRAILVYTMDKALPSFNDAVGSWKDVDIGDSVEFQRKIREDRKL